MALVSTISPFVYPIGDSVVISYPEQFRMLKEVCAHYRVPYWCMVHVRTYTAKEKREVLPPLIAVQKSITVRINGRYYLVSGEGDFVLTTAILHQIVEKCQLPRSKKATINPSDPLPEALCGLPVGMVSPFFLPHHQIQFSGVFCLTQRSPESVLCSLSLSLESSMIVFSRDLPSLLRGYASRVYPTVPLFFL